MNVIFHKKNLFIYIVMVIASIVFASYYGGPVSFALLYAMLLLVPVSFIYIFFNFISLHIYQEIEVHKLTKAEDHKYRAVIENAGLLPIHRMKLGLYTDRCRLYEIEEGKEVSLSSWEKTELNSSINCIYAGNYEVGIESVTFTDPFNILSVVLDVPYSFRAIVRPRITDVADRDLDLENIINNTWLKSNLLFEDIPGSDLRAYQKGDPLKSVNWKVSARLSEMMVRIPEKMEKRTVTILLKAANIPRGEQDIEFLKMRDYFLEFAVSAAWHFGRQNVPVKLIYPSGDIKESLVDSYESFMTFYNVVADGIFYNSSEYVNRIQLLDQKARGGKNDGDTWIIIEEGADKEDDFCVICD